MLDNAPGNNEFWQNVSKNVSKAKLLGYVSFDLLQKHGKETWRISLPGENEIKKHSKHSLYVGLWFTVNNPDLRMFLGVLNDGFILWRGQEGNWGLDLSVFQQMGTEIGT